MKESEVEDFIEESFRDGYSIDEIEQLLRDEGVPEKKIQQAVLDLKQKMQQRNERERASKEGHENIVKNIDLTDDKYTIKQRFFFNRYHIYDERGDLLLKAKQKLFRLKEEFPFTDSEGNSIFHVKAESMVDAGGDYTLKDEQDDEPIVILDRKYTLFRHRWRLRDPETEELLAKVHSENETVELIRWVGNLIPYVPNIFAFIPHSYLVESREGEVLAKLEGRLSIRDIYELKVEETGTVPKEALVAGSIAIDALEGN